MWLAEELAGAALPFSDVDAGRFDGVKTGAFTSEAAALCAVCCFPGSAFINCAIDNELLSLDDSPPTAAFLMDADEGRAGCC